MEGEEMMWLAGIFIAVCVAVGSVLILHTIEIDKACRQKDGVLVRDAVGGLVCVEEKK